MRVAAIVPAFNEEKTVGRVLEVLVKVPEVQEVIVVNDGSKDGTSKAARAFGVNVIDLPQNMGKGGAMLAGTRATDADILVFIDADLVGLSTTHISKLVAPVLAEKAHMTVGVFTDGRWTTDMAQKISPFLSGQRAMVRAIMDNIPNLENVGFGVEVAISRYVEKHHLRVEHVALPELSQVMKEEKRGVIRGVAHRLRMYWEIVRSFLM